MASYNELLALIDAYINRNGVQAITGQILNGVLKAMVDQLGRGYTLMGYAEPTGDPGTPDGPESWFASVPGTYANYGEIQVAAGELALLSFAPSEGWTKNTIYEGFREVTADIDGNVGTPEVGVSYANGVLSFDFRNMKGNPGVDGAAAGFGSVSATVDDQVGTPSVSVSSSGPDTAKVFSFAFHNLKGETGVTSVLATVDNTSGNPQCSVSLQGGQLTLAFTGLKGAQGDTGSSVDYPFTIVNNLTTDDPTQALSAAMGVELAGQVSQLEHKVDGFTEEQAEAITLVADKYYNSTNDPMPNSASSSPGTYCRRVEVVQGETYRITGLGGNKYGLLYLTADSDKHPVRKATTNLDARTTPLEIEIESGEAYLYVNLSTYDANTDKFEKITTISVPGLEQRVTALEEETIPSVTDETGTSSALAASQKLVTEIKAETDSAIADIEEAIEGTSQEEYLPVELNLESDKYYNTTNEPIPTYPASVEGISCARIAVTPGEKYKIYGLGGNQYTNLYVLTDSSRNKTRTSGANVNTRETSAEITIEEGEKYLYLDFVSYNAQTDKVEKSTIVTTPGLDGRITNLETRVGALENEEGIVVCIPDVIYAVVGDTLQLYYRSIFRCVDYSKYSVHLDCNIGAQYPRYFEVTPTAAQVGDHSLEVTIKDNNNNVLGTKTVTLSVRQIVNSPATSVNVLCVGDSGFDGGEFATEFKRRLVESGGTPAGSGLVNINFVGSLDVSYGGKQAKVEATGGYSFPSYTNNSTRRHFFYFNESHPFGDANEGDVYSFDGHNFTIAEINISAGVGNISCNSDYVGEVTTSGGTLTKVTGSGSETMEFSRSRTFGNPFVYNGVIDIQQYADDYCNPQNAEHGKVDIIYTSLFANGTPPYEDDASTRLAQMQAFIDQFRAVFPDCKFCIGLMHNPDIRGGMGVNYGATGNWHDAYAVKYSIMNLCNSLQEYINENNLGEYVYIVNWLNEFDEENDMRQTTKKVNPRSSVTEIFGVNGLHPSIVGYNQMADTAWRLFVAKFCQS